MTGVDIVHVPYRGQAPAMVDLLGGQIQLMFDTVPAALPSLKAGKLRALAVTTKTRFPAMPELPVMADFVPGYESSAIYGLTAPKATPSEITERVNREINAGIADEKMQARIAELGCLPLALSRAAFATLIAEETEKWGKVIKAANIKPE